MHRSFFYKGQFCVSCLDKTSRRKAKKRSKETFKNSATSIFQIQTSAHFEGDNRAHFDASNVARNFYRTCCENEIQVPYAIDRAAVLRFLISIVEAASSDKDKGKMTEIRIAKRNLEKNERTKDGEY